MCKAGKLRLIGPHVAFVQGILNERLRRTDEKRKVHVSVGRKRHLCNDLIGRRIERHGGERKRLDPGHFDSDPVQNDEPRRNTDCAARCRQRTFCKHPAHNAVTSARCKIVECAAVDILIIDAVFFKNFIAHDPSIQGNSHPTLEHCIFALCSSLTG